jgi:FtsP/CotA-like multicopper oxidase with cupredoxin domain
MKVCELAAARGMQCVASSPCVPGYQQRNSPAALPAAAGATLPGGQSDWQQGQAVRMLLASRLINPLTTTVFHPPHLLLRNLLQLLQRQRRSRQPQPQPPSQQLSQRSS